MLIDLVEGLRKWEAHVLTCKQCDAYDRSPSWLSAKLDSTNAGPCGVGRALILNILKILEEGL